MKDEHYFERVRNYARRKQGEIGSKYRAALRWAYLLRRVRSKKEYRGVEVRLTREEFIVWFMRRDFAGCSVDRIDVHGHYELSNMQVIPRGENSRKDKLTFTDTHGTCRRCHEVKEIALFSSDPNNKNGKTTMCKKCKAADSAMRQARKRAGSFL